MNASPSGGSEDFDVEDSAGNLEDLLSSGEELAQYNIAVLPADDEPHAVQQLEQPQHAASAAPASAQEEEEEEAEDVEEEDIDFEDGVGGSQEEEEEEMMMPGLTPARAAPAVPPPVAVAAAPCVQPGGDGSSSAPAAVPSSADFAREIDELMLSSSPPAASRPGLSGAPGVSQRGFGAEPEAEAAAAVHIKEGQEEGSEGNAGLGDAGGYTLDFDDDAAIG